MFILSIRVVFASLVLAATTASCSSNSDCGDIDSSSTSPLDIGVENLPASATASDVTLVVKGSNGDNPSLTIGGPSNGLFGGHGTVKGWKETYEVVVTYDGSVAFDQTMSWSVEGCGYSINIDLGSCFNDAGQVQHGSALMCGRGQ
jgi:hypothetical protein